MTGYAHAPPAAIASRKLKMLRKPFAIEQLCSAAESILAGR